MPPDLVARVHVEGTITQQLCEMLAAGVVHHRRMTSLADPAVHAPSSRERARALILWLLPLTVLGALIASLLLRARMEPAGDGTTEDREFIGRAIRGEEARFRREALKKFPGDTWSQGDDFSHQERSFVDRHTGRFGMRAGAVLDAIDRDVRAYPDLLPEHARGRVPPCMPRPFYQ